DEDFQVAGATICATAEETFASGEMIIKVKEPIEGDLALLRSDHLLFCYLHLAPSPELTKSLLDIGLTAVAFETVEEQGGLPLLRPMSQIAGRVAIDAGSHYLHQSMGGRGVLLGGVPGTDRGHVVVIGAGVAGYSAAMTAAGMGALVTVFDKRQEALAMAASLGENVTARYAYREAIAESLSAADLVVGAVLIPGAKAPHVVNRAMVRNMVDKSVIVDISIDQGGCIETMRPTNYLDPVFEEEGVLHMGVTNMPGAVPRTSSQALSGAILPFALKLADGQLEADPALLKGVNVKGGEIVHPVLKQVFG
ncbi:MAG: alanine dehydrogenase, partial [Pseudomonadales bacterium]|nr:alanine dehydrogenase [Pseudomonadales bacterium]